MTTKEAFDLGIQLALKVAEAQMDPTVQQGIQQRRTSAMAEGNRYAKGWSPNVPLSPTASAMASSTSGVGGAPKLPPVDYSAAAGAQSPYTAQIGQQGAWTRSGG
jgi:hypothetical protein